MKMKKSYLLIIFGILLVFFGTYVFISSFDKGTPTFSVKLLNKEEATNIVSEKVNYLVKVYEDSSKVFNVEEIDDGGMKLNKINNYEEIVNKLFTKNGLEQFENTVFKENNKANNFVTKKDNNIFLLSSLPSDNSYLNSRIVLNKINIKEDKITADVSFYNSKLEGNDLTYYIIVKELVLVKDDDSWLVDNFLYVNEK